MRSTAKCLPAVDREEPWPIRGLAGGGEQAAAGAAGELLPPEQVLDGGQGAAVRGLGAVKLKLEYRSFDGPAGRKQSSEVDDVVGLRAGQPEVRPPLPVVWRKIRSRTDPGLYPLPHARRRTTAHLGSGRRPAQGGRREPSKRAGRQAEGSPRRRLSTWATRRASHLRWLSPSWFARAHADRAGAAR